MKYTEEHENDSSARGYTTDLQPAVEQVAGVEAGRVDVQLREALLAEAVGVAEGADRHDAVERLGEVLEDGGAARRVQALDRARGAHVEDLDVPVDPGDRRHAEQEVDVGAGQHEERRAEREDLARPLTEGSISCGRAAFYQGI